MLTEVSARGGVLKIFCDPENFKFIYLIGKSVKMVEGALFI